MPDAASLVWHDGGKKRFLIWHDGGKKTFLDPA
jgi:hypothetical protein